MILRADGACFSAGGDLAEVKALVADPAKFSQFLDHWHATLGLFEQSPLPIIAAVHGLAFAGGLELVEVCDLVVIGDRTRIGDQHAMFGLFPAGGSTQRLPRLVGRRAAAWMLMTGEEITPAQALELGLVNRVVDEEHVARGGAPHGASACRQESRRHQRHQGGHASRRRPARPPTPSRWNDRSPSAT